MTQKVEIIYLFDQKDVDTKLEGVNFTKAEDFNLPQAVIAVYENEHKAVLHAIDIRDHADNWQHYCKNVNVLYIFVKKDKLKIFKNKKLSIIDIESFFYYFNYIF